MKEYIDIYHSCLWHIFLKEDLNMFALETELLYIMVVVILKT